MDLFELPSPGGSNAGGGAQTNITTTTVNLLLITNTWKYYQSGALAAGWQGTNYDDAAWPSGAALFYNESRACRRRRTRR